MPSISLPAAALVAGGVGAAGSIGSAVIGSNAAHQAANAQVQAAQIASNTQLGIFNQTQQNLQPYNTAGQSALSQLASLFGLGAGGPTNATAANATSALQNLSRLSVRPAAGQSRTTAKRRLTGLIAFWPATSGRAAIRPELRAAERLESLCVAAFKLAGSWRICRCAKRNYRSKYWIKRGESQLAAGQAAASGIVGSANAINTGIYSGLNNALLGYGLQQGGNLPTQSNLNNMNANWDQTNSQLGQYLGYT